MKTLVACLFALAISLAAAAPGATGVEPAYWDYPVKDLYKGKAAALDPSSHKDVERFRRPLEKGLLEGTNFAGKYTITTWGCGHGCTKVAMIDRTNGKVAFPSEINPLLFPELPDDEAAIARHLGFSFRPNSSLFIVTGVPGPQRYLATYFFNFKGGSFKLVHTVEIKSSYNRRKH